MLPRCPRWLPGCLPAWWELRPARPQGILISFTVEPDRAYSGDVMKTDDPIPSLRCFGEGENYSLHPGGMLCGSPCLAPVPHLISTSLAVFFFLFLFLWLSAFPCPCIPLFPPPPASGSQAGRQLGLVQTIRAADPSAGTSWEGTCCSSWLPTVHSSPSGTHHSHDPALRHSSPFPSPLLLLPVSCSSPAAFASPVSTHLHVCLLRAAALDEAAQQPRASRLPARLSANTQGESCWETPKASAQDLLNVS